MKEKMKNNMNMSAVVYFVYMMVGSYFRRVTDRTPSETETIRDTYILESFCREDAGLEEVCMDYVRETIEPLIPWDAYKMDADTYIIDLGDGNTVVGVMTDRFTIDMTFRRGECLIEKRDRRVEEHEELELCA